MQVQAGLFYEFHRYRVVSRAGQPILVRTNVEIGPVISREDALHQVENGKDIYTARRSDAEKLSISIFGRNPSSDRPADPSHFQHFHPGGIHPEFPPHQQGRPRAEDGFGHVFFGDRGENRILG
jgi:hypothetical protein